MITNNNNSTQLTTKNTIELFLLLSSHQTRDFLELINYRYDYKFQTFIKIEPN